jgi:outer membrane protein insertion porin family
LRRFFRQAQISVLGSILLTSCLGSKFLADDEQLLARYEVKGISSSIKDEAEGLVQQSPNSKPGIFGLTLLPFTHLAHAYKLGENGMLFIDGYNEERTIQKKAKIENRFQRRIEKIEKDEKKIRVRNRMIKKLDKKDRKLKEGNQLMRWGENLAVYDSQLTKISIERIEVFLNSKGYFNSKVSSELKVLNKKRRIVQANYIVKTGARHLIDSIEYNIEDPELDSLISLYRKRTPLKKGYYDQEILKNERDYLYNVAVNKGYFEFSKQFISFEIDSTQLGDQRLFVRETIRNPAQKNEHKIFTLDSIIFTSNASITQSYKRTVEEFKGVTFNFGKNKYSKKILQWRIPLEVGQKYSRDETIETQRQLSYLDNFKFVNINYDTTGNKFIANIFTSPLDKYQTSNEFGFTQTSGAVPGPFFTLNLKNRNTFRALEVVSLDANIKLEGISGISEQDERYSSRQYGGQLSFSFPQFLFPLTTQLKKAFGSYNPKTRFSLGLSYEQRIDEYIRRTIQSSLTYTWQVRDKLKYTLTPIQASLIRSDNTDAFDEFLNGLREEGNTYANAFESAFVGSSSMQVDLNLGEYSQGKQGGFVRFYGELGGNVNNLFNETAFGDSIQIYRYVKGNIDIRKIDRLNRKLNIAYRLNVGVAYAYGANNSLPYEKYFFAGGSNSLRAWKPRRLGPGAFGIISSEGLTRGLVDFTREQPGDLIIESSIELRQKLVGFLEGAIFLDAGNVWLIEGSSVDPDLDPEGDDGKFRFNEFMNEMAVGTGIGFRFDLSFLIFRLDLGLKLFDPAQPKGNRFVGDRIFSNFGPSSELNIGIGYSF